MRTLQDDVRDECRRHPANSAESIAIAVMRDLKVSAAASRRLLPAVAAFVETFRRGEVRVLEREVFTGHDQPHIGSHAASVGSVKRHVDGLQPRDRTAARIALMARTFRVDGRDVTWGYATVDDHRAYIEMLRRQVGGLCTTIRAHEQAIAEIEAAGVECLNDVYGNAS